MREFELNIDKALVSGITPDDSIPRNAEFLYDALNVKTSKVGLKPYSPIIDPFNSSYTVAYPFPQLFLSQKSKLLVDEDSVYSVDSAINPWQYSSITFEDLDGNIVSPTANGTWDFIDLKDSWMLINGKSVLFKDVSGLLRNIPDRNICINDLSINSGCYHKGRIVLGGFDSSNVFSDRWEDIINEFIYNNSENIDIPFKDIDGGYVMWSSVGGGDFPLWLIRPELAIFGPMDIYEDNYDYNFDRFDQSLLFETLLKNQFGYMPMDWSGDVLGVAPLDNKVIVFGDNGITALTAVNGDISTYGKQNIMPLGIPSKDSYCYDEEKILFVTSDGFLWLMSGNLEKQKLGYSNLINTLDLTKLTIHKVSTDLDEEYIITDGTSSILWTQQGVTRVSQCPTSVITLDGNSYGLHVTNNGAAAIIISGTYDLGIRALKTITSINLGVFKGGRVEVAIDYRYDTNSDFTRTPYVPVNREGNAVLRVTCLDFRIIVKADDYTEFELDKINVRYQVSDKRQIRGMYASGN